MNRIPRLGTGAITSPDGKPLTNFQSWVNTAFSKIERTVTEVAAQVGLIQMAQATAEGAQETAEQANAKADQALTTITGYASDNVLTPVEKKFIIREVGVILDEQDDLGDKATLYGVTTEKTNYDTAVTALISYLATLTTPHAWNSLNGLTTIVGSTFTQKFSDAVSAAKLLRNAIYAAAKSGISNAQVTANAAALEAADARDEAALLTAELAEIASDNILARNEKRRVVREYSDILNAQTDDNAKADLYGITTEKAAYGAAIVALTNYLATLTFPVAWNIQSGNTNIVASVWNSKWSDVIRSRVLLLNKIAARAKEIADAAASNAAAALAQIDAIARDGVLDRSEKAQVIRMFGEVTGEKPGLNAAAAAAGVTSENTSYNAAYAALQTYLVGLSPSYTDVSQDTTITRTTFNQKWNDYYVARSALRNKIAGVDATSVTLKAWGDVSRINIRGNASYELAGAHSGQQGAVSTESHAGGILISAEMGTLADGYCYGSFGLSETPTPTSAADIKFGLFIYHGTYLYVHKDGAAIGNPNGYDPRPGEVFNIVYDELSVTIRRGATPLHTFTAADGVVPGKRYYLATHQMQGAIKAMKMAPHKSASSASIGDFPMVQFLSGNLIDTSFLKPGFQPVEGGALPVPGTPHNRYGYSKQYVNTVTVEETVGPHGKLASVFTGHWNGEGYGAGMSYRATKRDGFDPKRSYRAVLWLRQDSDDNGQGMVAFGRIDNATPLALMVGDTYVVNGFGTVNVPNDGKWYAMICVVHGCDYAGGNSGETGLYDLMGNRLFTGQDYKLAPAADHVALFCMAYGYPGSQGQFSHCEPTIWDMASAPSVQSMFATVGAPEGTFVGDRAVIDLVNEIDVATERLLILDDNNKVDKAEKKIFIPIYKAWEAKHPLLVSKGNALGLDTGPLVAAWNSLADFVSLYGLVINPNGTSNVLRGSLDAVVLAYETAAKNLDLAMADKAARAGSTGFGFRTCGAAGGVSIIGSSAFRAPAGGMDRGIISRRPIKSGSFSMRLPRQSENVHMLFTTSADPSFTNGGQIGPSLGWAANVWYNTGDNDPLYAAQGGYSGDYSDLWELVVDGEHIRSVVNGQVQRTHRIPPGTEVYAFIPMNSGTFEIRDITLVPGPDYSAGGGQGWTSVGPTRAVVEGNQVYRQSGSTDYASEIRAPAILRPYVEMDIRAGQDVWHMINFDVDGNHSDWAGKQIAFHFNPFHGQLNLHGDNGNDHIGSGTNPDVGGLTGKVGKFAASYDGIRFQAYLSGQKIGPAIQRPGLGALFPSVHAYQPGRYTGLRIGQMTDADFDSMGGANVPEAKADVTSQIEPGVEVVIECDHNGVPLENQLPRRNKYSLIKNGVPQTGVTWYVAVKSGRFNNADPAATEYLLGANADGSVTYGPDSLQTIEAIMTMIAIQGSHRRTRDVKLRKNLAAPPSSGGGGTSGGGTGNTGGTTASTNSISSTAITTFAALSVELPVTVGNSGSVQLSAPLETSTGGGSGAAYQEAEIKWEWWNGGAWEQVNASALSDPDAFYYQVPNDPVDVTAEPGFVTCNTSKVGLPVGSAQKFRLSGRKVSSGTKRIYFSGTASAQG